MNDNRRIRVAITHGDTNGIGYELIFKAFNEPEMLEFCTPIIYGSPKVAAYYRKAMNLPAQFSIIQKAEDAEDGRINLLAAVEEEVKVDMGMPTQESGAAAVKALDRAMTDYRDGLYDVLVTAPVSNQNIRIEGYTFLDHKDYIETCLGDGNHALTLLLGNNLRFASITGRIPMSQVPKSITAEGIIQKTTLLWQTLKRDFLITNPRIAVLALNPSINEDQSSGTEERNIIIPAINTLADQGIQAFGPYPAEDFFSREYYNEFDGVMAMFHDQVAVPFNSIEITDGVLYTAGLPIIHAEANCTPRYDMTGFDEADALSFRNAIFTVLETFRSRETSDEASQNPLPKLFHEKRDESEKVRFAIPKKNVPSPFPPKGGNKQNNAPKGNNEQSNAPKNNHEQNNAPKGNNEQSNAPKNNHEQSNAPKGNNEQSNAPKGNHEQNAHAQQSDKKFTQQPNPAEKQAQPAPQKPAEQPAPQPAE